MYLRIREGIGHESRTKIIRVVEKTLKGKENLKESSRIHVT